MQLKASLVIPATALGFAGTAAASPITFEARETAMDDYLYVCTDVDWSGICQNLGFFAGECYNFPAEFQEDISSIGPPQGWECVIYDNYNCDGGYDLYAVYPGNAYLNETDYNDVLSSFVCTRT
ncbi:uncharacterized protein PHACADRAFT_259456 [Phanerochaete carnosa HHB-10118-sp]|uniref:Beta/gamma crystallin 'Greek key' domain-containing protein n=1 Tax=Phanerochaete carnosa (strain HHB-10118-sp) TaxID=650164 RepID=K5WS67_PHACS|nr:uncharacterized protein PHACADRAFT_259456 [Phanerochaete carnosa HHB-10118-sp]EKM53242.1 hypothetical protein PHACADRAFT_259456 [Phanerochaete carnosa HHB-10118-sp]